MTYSPVELARGQRVLTSLIGARIVDATAIEGAVQLDVCHRGTDDDAAILVVPLSGIHFADEDDG